MRQSVRDGLTLRFRENLVDVFVDPCCPRLKIGVREETIERFSRLAFSAGRLASFSTTRGRQQPLQLTRS